MLNSANTSFLPVSWSCRSPEAPTGTAGTSPARMVIFSSSRYHNKIAPCTQGYLVLKEPSLNSFCECLRELK